jgi:predicted nucleic acid-binding protein
VSIALDTNILLRLITGRSAEAAALARMRLDQLRDAGETALVSDLVINEAFHVLRHHYAVPPASAVDVLREIMDEPSIRGEVAPLVLAQLSPGDASDVPDRLILAHSTREGATLLTFDRRLARLPGTERLVAGPG